MKPNRSQMKNVRPFSRPKSAKRGIHVKGSWKAVELDPSLFSEEGMGGLVCFEELTDYRLIDSAKEEAKAEAKAEKDKKKREERKEKKKAKKRKASEGDKDGGKQEEVCEGGSDKNETSEKPARKKNKKKTAQQNDPTTQNDVSVDSKVKGEEVRDEVQNLENGSENVVVKEEKENAPEETVSQDAVTCPEDAQPQSNNTMTDGKNKKKRKKKRKVEKQTVPESQLAQESQTELPPQGKMSKLTKKKAKNWTNAARSGSDQNSDVTAWKDLFVPDQVLKALSSLGFGSPTAIQALALPPAIRDHMDIVGAAETGSGKTLSFGIPMIHHILEWKKGVDESEGVTDGQTEPGTQVESLYLPTVEESVETSISMDTSNKVTEPAPKTSAESKEACTEETTEQEDPQEHGSENVAEDKGAADDKEIIEEDDEKTIKQEEVCEGCSVKNEMIEKPARKKNKNKSAQQNNPTTQDDIPADSKVISEEVSDKFQNLENGSDNVVVKEEEERNPMKKLSHKMQFCSEDAEPQSNNTKTDGKNNKKRKNKINVEK